ncbi:MAG: transposase [Verrucomicrobiae bacterium]|nr:transposase [Verrucomicrobiae bacterium]
MRKVIYRSKRSWHTKKNFQIFEVTDFLATAVEHIPPKGQQTVRYYGLYSNKRRGMDARAGRHRPTMREAAAPKPAGTASETLFVIPPPEPESRRALRPLWRDLIQKIWGEDPMICPCCKGTMTASGTMIRREDVQFFLHLHRLWEWERSGHRLPSGSPEGGTQATSTGSCSPTAASSSFRHRDDGAARRAATMGVER